MTDGRAFYITREGARRLQEELARLLTRDRAKVVQEVADAAAQGDRSENAEYIYGKKKLREIDRRIHWLTKRLESVTVVDPRAEGPDVAYFGAFVDVEDEDGGRATYRIVGEDENRPGAAPHLVAFADRSGPPPAPRRRLRGPDAAQRSDRAHDPRGPVLRAREFVRRPGSVVVCLACLGALAWAPVATAVAHAQQRAQLSLARSRADATIESAPGGGGACPEGMTAVEGDYCPRVEQTLPAVDGPARAVPRVPLRRVRPAGAVSGAAGAQGVLHRPPRTDRRRRRASAQRAVVDRRRAELRERGRRVCLESEWTFACEGEEMRPYPYGWSRDAEACNADNVDLLDPNDPRRLRDQREPAGAHPACASPFGVLDMAGNVAEWVSVDGVAAGTIVVQKGNWWQPGKHACRDAQGGHDRYYKGTETGFRCCADEVRARPDRAVDGR